MTRFRRPVAFALVGLTVVGLVLVLPWRPTDATNARPFEISSIDLTTGVHDATLSTHGMLPGDAVTAAVTVANSGRQPITYTMSRGQVSTSGDALSAALILTVKAIGSSCADFDGTTLFNGPLDQAAFGKEGGGRSLPAATAEILCLRAVLPLDADNGLQGAAATVTLSFGATWLAAVR